jgi:hypothetical protein
MIICNVRMKLMSSSFFQCSWRELNQCMRADMCTNIKLGKVSINSKNSEISGYQSGKYEDDSLLRYCTM